MVLAISNQFETVKGSVRSLGRAALAFGLLTPAAEAEINRSLAKEELSSYDLLVLAVLKDALQEGRVRRQNA
jgi:hypothetical protein